MNAWAFQPTSAMGTTVVGIMYAHVTINMAPDHGVSDHSNSIQKLIAERELDPRKAAALARARKRISVFLEDGGDISLSKLRLSKGLSQTQLANAMNVKQPYIARIESGMDDLRLSTIESLAKALNEPVERITVALCTSRLKKERAV